MAVFEGLEPVVTAKQMQCLEQLAIEQKSVPAILLMEQAAEALVKAVPKEASRILAICGTGNNGADAAAAVRKLALQGKKTDILLLGDTIKSGSLLAEQTAFYRYVSGNAHTLHLTEQGIVDETGNICSLLAYDVLLDGIFGIGLNRTVPETISRLMESINRMPARPMVIAVDTPSGVDAGTGAILGNALRADLTVTFSYAKTGLLLYPGKAMTGKLVIAPIGLREDWQSVTDYACSGERFEPYQKRDPAGNKGTFGRIQMLAGSEQMPGAAILAAKAAYRAGAGLVQVCGERKLLDLVLIRVPEVVTAEKPSDNGTVLLCGPGIGKTESAEEKLNMALAFTGKKVLDADALNLLADRLDREQVPQKERMHRLQELVGSNTILTPHPKELSRLLGVSVQELQANRLQYAKWLQGQMDFVLIWKDAVTLVIAKEVIYLNRNGNDGMATAGSGDVLAGICAAFYNGYESAAEAAVHAVYVHGQAGDRAAKLHGTHGVMAWDLADCL